MDWDLGLQGMARLLIMAAVFGAVVELVTWRRGNRWTGLIAAGVYLVAGVFVSEVWFGWATGEELQPNIDGLSSDEVLLLAPLISVAVLLIVAGVRRILHRTRAPGDGHPTPGAPTGPSPSPG